MKFGIRAKLLVMLLLAVTTVVAGMFVLTRWSFERGFSRYITSQEKDLRTHLVAALADEFEAGGGWDRLRNDPQRWRQIQIQAFLSAGVPHRPPRDFEMPAPPPESHGPRDERHAARRHARPGVRIFRSRHVVVPLDRDRSPIVGGVELSGEADYFPVEVGNAVQGYLGIDKRRRRGSDNDVLFSRGQARAFTWIAVLMVVVAILIVLPLSHHLLKPVRRLSGATRELASGNFRVRIPVDSGDELGALSRDFNSLAKTLEENESARRQWIADISHELRTPLAVLRGEVEAMQDGVHGITPARLEALHGEVVNLGRLVDDLYQLSLSDLGALSYQKAMLDLRSLLEASVESYRREFEDKSLALGFNVAGGGDFEIFADRDRLQQLFSNLLSNSLRYTDPGGELRIILSESGDMVTVIFDDSAPGVPEAQRPRLFDRLFRVEDSRSRAGGGSGLGLAICRNIVHAHDGTISAADSPLGGLRITINLPRHREP